MYCLRATDFYDLLMRHLAYRHPLWSFRHVSSSAAAALAGGSFPLRESLWCSTKYSTPDVLVEAQGLHVAAGDSGVLRVTWESSLGWHWWHRGCSGTGLRSSRCGSSCSCRFQPWEPEGLTLEQKITVFVISLFSAILISYYVLGAGIDVFA